ncbi:hypothetical protein Zmor_011706 [Zophobas morio]|uniref:Uncharacterized protein n=1 Tax=Zophobas morio TaxID=2755281 RepID=A0AA38MKN0_9CUCU|nr:hypothetical protein Zmor_011706 [Zophobas morio]
MDMFIEMRTLAGVDSSNKYLFGYPNADGHLDASVVLREYSRQCNADFPGSLRSTKLRQQVATMTQLLNLNQNELHQLSDFMGHDFSVHLKHYRMNEINSQITPWSRFFSAVGRTDVYRHRNKSLDQLETYISDNETEEKDESDPDEAVENHVGPEEEFDQVKQDTNSKNYEAKCKHVFVYSFHL